jgi:hypothetical protein
MTLRHFCALICRPSIALRGLKFAVVVGPILIAINHGDVILAGSVQASTYLKMGLTLMVPYAVSVLSSVGAVMAHESDPNRTVTLHPGVPREEASGPPR